MTGNKMNNKKKEEKSKTNRINRKASDEVEGTDFSLLRKPILTNITGFAQARKIFDQATEELKNLLTNECDLLYECKVCRNMFRSLVNFISHKRIYCKEKYKASTHGQFFKETCSIQEVLKIRELEESYQESLKEINDPNFIEDGDCDERIPLSKDITKVVERLVKQRGVQKQKLQEQEMVFQKIPKTSVAVFQNVKNIDDDNVNDSMQAQVKELDHILSQKNAILQSDGTVKIKSHNNESPNVIQISDDEENENMDVLKCRICDLQFSTQKTLKFHMKYKHLESRLVYPCPDCLDIFSTSWSVYRHLFKVHRKTAAQIRRLRESIQAKAFKMNNPPAFYERRKAASKNLAAQKITEEERLDQENQAWLEQLDGEGDGRRCGGCGRSFERRAALAAHAHTCARRHRRRIQIQIRKDYHKDEHNPYLPPSAAPSSATSPAPSPVPSPVTSPPITSPSVTSPPITSPHVTSPSVTSPPVPPRAPTPKPPAETATIIEDTKEEEKIVEKDSNDEVAAEPPTEAVMTIMDEKKDTDEVDKAMEPDENIVQNKPNCYDTAFKNKLPFAQQAEKSNLNAFRQKLISDTDIEQLQCKRCDNKFNEFTELYNHMGAHYKWVRYACKLCNFKHFHFDKLPEHVKIVHKLKGDTDFYYSTVKAVDGAEALELAETIEEVNDPNEVNPNSRRPSRCSSDSSRVSDDSSSSSTRVEVGSRKRKVTRYKNNSKKKKETVVADDADDPKEDESQKDVLIENESSSNSKIFEENSSDLDDLDEKITKRLHVKPIAITSRRPVRKKTKPQNEDYEYDLSNLLKMEAQGYRETITTKSTQGKKKLKLDLQQNYDLINKDCCGALVTLSRKSVENAQSHMKTVALFNASKDTRISTVFARPMTPKLTKDKISPKKDEKELKDTSSPNKVIESSNVTNLNKVVTNNKVVNTDSANKESSKTPEIAIIKDPQDNSVKIVKRNDKTPDSFDKEENKDKLQIDTVKHTGTPSVDATKTNLNLPIVPIKFRRQSLEVIKNPLIKKNITDFTKAGMKTKILVIKPINRNSDGTQSLNSPLKFQTIKLKDPNKGNLSDDKKDQVVVVQVPKVDCTVTKPVSSNNLNNIVNSAKPSSVDNVKKPVSQDDSILMDTSSSENEELILEDGFENCKQIDSESNSDSSKPVIKSSEVLTNVNKTTNAED